MGLEASQNSVEAAAAGYRQANTTARKSNGRIGIDGVLMAAKRSGFWDFTTSY
jgi:hypothetical protein